MIEHQVAIIGAGISGSLAALELTDAGFDVALIDACGEPMMGASRWNEGKIHLGYCYLGDPSFHTPALMLDGAAAFIESIERWTGRTLKEDWFTQPVVYIVDPDTQFPADQLWARSQRLANLLVERAGAEPSLRRFVDGLPVLASMKSDDAATATGLGRIAAAWQTSECCVAPGPVAGLIREALQARQIPVHRAAARTLSQLANGWRIGAEIGDICARAIINASWESRTLLDRQVVASREPCSIRFKYALFGSGLKAVTKLAPSTRIIGRFGDVTPYGNGEAYLSWYPDGLAGVSDDGRPPVPVEPELDTLIARTLAGLGLGRDLLEEPTAAWEVRGGYVVAHGSGDIDRATSPLHYRNRLGAFELAPGYISVDTGKYSCGPMVASHAAGLIARRLTT